MALVWCDGFEGYADSNAQAPAPSGIFADKYLHTVNEAQWDMQNDTVRSDWALELPTSAYHSVMTTDDVCSGNTVIAGVGFYVNSKNGWTGNYQWPLLAFRTSSNATNVELVPCGSSFFVKGPNNTYLGGTRVNLDAQEYHFIEMKVYADNSSGTVEVRVNGCPVFTATGIDTYNGGTTTRVSVGDAHQIQDMNLARIDDFYVCDGSGSKNNDFLGDVTVKTLWPDGDDTTQFATTANGSKATHYEQVNEIETLRATDYVEDGSTGNRDKFTLDNPTDNFATVHGVMVWAQANYVTAATNYRLLIDSGGTESESANIAANVAFKYDSNVWEDDPDTASAWTNTTINAVKSGFEIQ